MRGRIRCRRPFAPLMPRPGISCPQAVVVVPDGLFARVSLGLRVFTPLWALAALLVHVVTALIHFAIYFPLRLPLKADFSDKASVAGRAKFAFLLAWRYLLMRTLSVIRVEAGGHHMHLTEPDKTVEAASEWLADTSSRCGKQ
mmetsp:Transcript_38919/g.78602  ORF Transcript_38919/g.78602 Transcript_38919/m.78602 type:complete len:143 (-) Transcript_38919:81-509(-)